MDCLIARVAVEHYLLLLQEDRDFEKMSGVVADLALAWAGGDLAPDHL